MKLYHVVAMANNRVIGKENKLPWPKLSEDLKFFKELTMGSNIIMGRKTFDSLPGVLPGRYTIVLTKNCKTGRPVEDVTNRKVWFENSIESALKFAEGTKMRDEIFIIGGAEIFKQTFNLIDGIYLTRIYENYPGDTLYPELPDFFEPASSKLLPSENGPRMEVIYYENTHKVKPGTAIGKME